MAKLNKRVKQFLVITLGTIFIILGLIGLVLPFLQGFLFLAIGLIILSLYSPSLRDFIDRHTVKYPSLHRMFGKANEWVIKVLGAPEE